MKTTLYQLHLTGRLKHMVIEVKENQIITEWWTSKEDEDGKKQNTKETVYGKNQGRSNETSDEEQAILEFERKVKKKKEEGYRIDYDDWRTYEAIVNSIKMIDEGNSAVGLLDIYFCDLPSLKIGRWGGYNFFNHTNSVHLSIVCVKSFRCFFLWFIVPKFVAILGLFGGFGGFVL